MSFDVSPLHVQAVPLGMNASHVRLLRAEGSFDAANERILRDALVAGDDGTIAHVVIDVSDVTLLSAAGVRALLHHADRLTSQGRRLMLAGPSPLLVQILHITRAAQILEVFVSVEAAVAACLSPSPDSAYTPVHAVNGTLVEFGDEAEIKRMRNEVRALRGQVRSRPLISQALGILQERYGLPGADAAFALMKEASQRFNVKLRTLADAVVHVPRPDEDSALWFPGRGGNGSPSLGFLDEARPNQGTVIRAVLTEAMTSMDSDMGDLQLSELDGALQMQEHHGFDDDFLDFFAHVDGEETACFQAAARREYVMADVATDPVYPEPSRAVLLAARSRTVHSIPMTGGSREVLGVFSVHHSRVGQHLSAGQERRFNDLASEAGAWLEWHQGTVVLDALEHLHGGAQAR